jgi:hypothetical protein
LERNKAAFGLTFKPNISNQSALSRSSRKPFDPSLEKQFKQSQFLDCFRLELIGKIGQVLMSVNSLVPFK